MRVVAPVPAASDANQMKFDPSGLLLSLFVLVSALPATIQGFSMSIAANTASKEAAASAKRSTGDSELGNNVPGALVEHAVAWASANGLGMVVNDDSGLFTGTHLPFSLLPYGELSLFFFSDV